MSALARFSPGPFLVLDMSLTEPEMAWQLISLFFKGNPRSIGKVHIRGQYSDQEKIHNYSSKTGDENLNVGASRMETWRTWGQETTRNRTQNSRKNKQTTRTNTSVCVYIIYIIYIIYAGSKNTLRLIMRYMKIHFCAETRSAAEEKKYRESWNQVGEKQKIKQVSRRSL